MATRYITTTIPYVNADPHIGFALEIIQADALARAWRLRGDEVFFNTGTDEHGQKIYEAAVKAGQGVQEYVDYYANEVKKLREALDLSNDAFIRTTETYHIEAAQEMWRKCDAAGDIYKKQFEGLYCVGCEAYKTIREIENGHCSLHPSLELQTIAEENYFFKFSKYQDRLLEYLSRPDVIVPEWRRAEAIEFVKSGLEDFSISREKKRLSWGIPVPEDNDQVMYVWFDALTDYISTLGWPADPKGTFKKFWEEGHVVQMAGKDQVRFQSLMWQAMLMSAQVKNTDQVFYHGFIISDGQRMSKSLGNVISPYEMVEKYGTDATRYLLLRHAHPFQDSDITWEKLDEWYNAGLANGLGNLVSRVMKMAEEHLEGPPASLSEEISEATFFSSLSDYQFDTVCEVVWLYINGCDQKIQMSQPFRLVKEDKEKGKRVIEELVIQIYTIANMLNPLMPTTSKIIKDAVKANKKPENLFARKE
ncbi:MAG: methionine--tRNA ligase [Patescibacteria group bacterium]